jgi:hypothetical protein
MAKPTFKDLAAFKMEHDPNVKVPIKIKAALASLLAEGKEAAEYELDFIKRCGPGVGATHIAAFREQFAAHIVTVRANGKSEKRVWFGDPKVAAKARGDA